jgi:ribose-phosphate pyrophosphokinase
MTKSLSYLQHHSPTITLTSISSAIITLTIIRPTILNNNNNLHKKKLFPSFNSHSIVYTSQATTDHRKHKCRNDSEFSPLCDKIRLFSGTANEPFAKKIAQNLGMELSLSDVGRFADGEVSIKILRPVRGADVYVVQPTSPPVADNIMELLLFISALREASAKHVTAIVPYFGYMRSDGSGAKRALRSALHDPEEDSIETHRTSYLAMADVAQMFEVAGCSTLVTVDLHASGQSVSEGFFTQTKVENVRSAPLVAKVLVQALNLNGPDVTSSNNNNTVTTEPKLVIAAYSRAFTKAKKFQSFFKSELTSNSSASSSSSIIGDDGNLKNVGLALVVRRPTNDVKNPSIVDLVGDVRGKDVLIVDDVIDTGRSLTRAAAKAKEAGAKRVFAFISHPVLTGLAPQLIQDCDGLEKVWVLNTVPISDEHRKACSKLEIIDVSESISNLIKELHLVGSGE